MLFSEKLLHYVWRHRLFNIHDLQTITGEPVQVASPGSWNTNAGPDFLDARVRVGNTLLAGNVELHLKASDWIRHDHNKDKQYSNLILHVVYEYDLAGEDNLPRYMPTIELQGRIPGLLIERYIRLMQHGGNILCAGQLDKVNELTWFSWKDRLLIERWQQKTALFAEWMRGNHNNWEETFYLALARNFGMPVNGDAFEALARSIPLKILARHKDNLLHLEALCFGQAGMLHEKLKEEYPLKLYKEYLFLQRKYSLTPMRPHLWKWMRMRPSAFPSIRLAQFAALVHRSSHLFSNILETRDIRHIESMFLVSASSYWDNHYHLLKRGEKELPASSRKKQLGKSMIQSILINTICPMLAMYDQFQLQGEYLDRAFEWMKTLPPENNRYTREWEELSIDHSTAWDSQALLQLTKYYCTEKRCLECAVGNKILNAGRE
jgi:hypothetical protein